jgi:UPF0755 protein
MRWIRASLKAAVLALLGAAGLAVVSLWYLLSRADEAHGPTETPVRFVVSKGEGVVSIADRLEAEGIIDGRLTFLVYVLKTGQYKEFQVGEYALSGNLTLSEIAERLVQGKVVPAGVRVTFPEGWTAEQIAERLTANGLPGADFLSIVQAPFPKWRERFPFLASIPPGQGLEGYLFPDTYIFPPAATSELIVSELLENFGKKAAPLITSDLAGQSFSFHELVTLASMIEEEGRTAEDRKNISDVFRKRLAIGQALQSDATINYILGTAKDQPTFEDLKADSPYNTYARPGLPPGPIGNPSLMSIDAALHPTPNPYFYFLINPETRVTYFGRDFEEHQRNRLEHGL